MENIEIETLEKSREKNLFLKKIKIKLIKNNGKKQSCQHWERKIRPIVQAQQQSLANNSKLKMDSLEKWTHSLLTANYQTLDGDR